MSSQVDFGYPWFLSYGHLVIVAIALPLWLLAYKRKWRPTLMVLISGLLLWSVVAFVVARFTLDFNGPMAMPTGRFLSSGTGRVLDMGAGTGKSAMMVLEARPKTTVVALDLFAESYEHHFGHGQSGQERLMSNLKAVGLDDRATIQTGDMRKLPFQDAEFDGIVSSYAIDHLSTSGIDSALKEANRVLKPGGEFLLMVINKDSWLKFTFGPLLLHSGTHNAYWWNSRLQSAGFEVVEQGTRPATIYAVSRKP